VFAGHVSATLTACALGLTVAIGVAVPAGLLLGGLPGEERAVRPFIESLRAIPSLVLTPLALSLLGDPTTAKTVLIVYSRSWPLLIITLYGMLEVDVEVIIGGSLTRSSSTQPGFSCPAPGTRSGPGTTTTT
jgi:NitT/TauT family transport system permease protein